MKFFSVSLPQKPGYDAVCCYFLKATTHMLMDASTSNLVQSGRKQAREKETASINVWYSR